jgi:DNA polymerase-3 subunit delta'
MESVAGHRTTKQYLLSALEGGILPHSLLFHGPRGVGKMSMAYALAKTVNCRSVAGSACPCDPCRKIRDGVFVDLLTVEPRGAAGQITLAGWRPGKDDPDGLQYYRFVDARPLEGARKVLMIRQAERMNVALANYLLKLIEEPPSYLTLVFLTHRPGDLLQTIRSRCAPVRFSPLDRNEMLEFLAGVGLDPQSDEVAAVMRLAEGRPGLLIDLLQAGTSELRDGAAAGMRLFQELGFLSLFRVAADLAPARWGGTMAAEDFENVVGALCAWIRDALLVRVLGSQGAAKLVLNSDKMSDLERFAAPLSAATLVEAFATVCEAYEYAPRQTDKAFVLETVLLRLGRILRR